MITRLMQMEFHGADNKIYILYTYIDQKFKWTSFLFLLKENKNLKPLGKKITFQGILHRCGTSQYHRVTKYYNYYIMKFLSW